MADYITIDDITSYKMNTFPDEIKQEYVDRGNEWYLSLALSKGVREDDIYIPLPQICKDAIIAKIQMDFYKDRIQGNSVETAGVDAYTVLYGVEAKSYSDTIVRITPQLIRGEINKYSSTTIMGRRVGAYGHRFNEEGDEFCQRYRG